ncbi:MAG: recombinase family protein [Candidatus Saccharimonadia bacterium]
MAHMRTIALARVSSKAQEDEGYSLDAQLKLIRNYCRDNKLNVIHEFRISETASKNEQRSVFRQMLSYINTNNIAHVVVEKTDRLTRNLRDAVVVDDWLENDERRRLHMVKENLVVHKHAKSDAKLMWNIYLAFAKKYTDNLREEAMKGWDEKLAQGWMPAPPPPGYKTATENSKKIHVIDEETSPVVTRAFKLYLEPGQTISTVTDELAQCGLTTKKHRPLAKSAVNKMLRNPFYVGVIRFNNREYPGAHEPLIDNNIFNAVQIKLGEHKSKQRHHDPLFSGLLQCLDCHKMVTWQLQKGRYYGACQRRQDACKKRRMIREDYLEEAVCEELRTIGKKAAAQDILQCLKQKIAENRHPYVGQHRVQVVKLIKQQIRHSEMMSDNLYGDKLSGVISEETYQKKQEDIEIRLMQLRDRLIRIEELEGKMSFEGSRTGSIIGMYTSESKIGKRLILATLFKINLARGGVNIQNMWPNK